MADCNIFLDCFLFVCLVISVWVQTSAALCDESVLRNNYSPHQFHHVHGEHIKLTNNKRVASRQNPRSVYNNGIVFSNRTVTICEPVYVKLLETSNYWFGTLAIGFTMNDPESFQSKLPGDVIYTDFLRKKGNWAKEVDEKLAKKGSVIHYYADQNGDVHYGIDGEEYGIFFGGVNTTGRLWAVIDVYGRTVGVQFIAALCDRSVLRNNHSPLHFHHVHEGRITFSNNRRVASRQNSRSSHDGIVFSNRTVMICEPVYVKILETSNYFYESVTIGFTMIDPQSFESKLSEDATYSYFLSMDGSWAKEVDAKLAKKGSVIHYYADQNGDVHYGIDGEEYGIFFGGVNTSGRLWAVIDVSGRTVAVEFIEYNHVDNSTDTSFEATTDWYTTEMVEYMISTVTETTTEEEVLTVTFTDAYFDEPGPSQSYSNAESAVLPCSNSQPTREISPVSNTPRDPIYPPASPRRNVDISINFPIPFGQRGPAPDIPHLVHPGRTRNYLKNKPPSAQIGRGIERFLGILGVILGDSERFSTDTRDRSFRKADEELSSEHADASHSQNNDTPTPFMALFLIPNSYSANIRVNDEMLG